MFVLNFSILVPHESCSVFCIVYIGYYNNCITTVVSHASYNMAFNSILIMLGVYFIATVSHLFPRSQVKILQKQNPLVAQGNDPLTILGQVLFGGGGGGPGSGIMGGLMPGIQPPMIVPTLPVLPASFPSKKNVMNYSFYIDLINLI